MSDDPLRDLETAAREAMLRSPPRQARSATCSAERLWAAFSIDAVLGLLCLFGGGLTAGALLESVAPFIADRALDSVLSLFTACCPLVYSAMDWLLGNTPGKAMMGVRIEGPLRWRPRVFKRWAIKGAPFIAAAVASALVLSQTVRVGVPLFVVPQYLLVMAAWCILIGCIWWLVGSVILVRTGQTFPDAFAGTRLVRDGAQPPPQGFEPVLVEGDRNQARGPREAEAGP